MAYALHPSPPAPPRPASRTDSATVILILGGGLVVALLLTFFLPVTFNAWWLLTGGLLGLLLLLGLGAWVSHRERAQRPVPEHPLGPEEAWLREIASALPDWRFLPGTAEPLDGNASAACAYLISPDRNAYVLVMPRGHGHLTLEAARGQLALFPQRDRVVTLTEPQATFPPHARNTALVLVGEISGERDALTSHGWLIRNGHAALQAWQLRTWEDMLLRRDGHAPEFTGLHRPGGESRTPLEAALWDARQLPGGHVSLADFVTPGGHRGDLLLEDVPGTGRVCVTLSPRSTCDIRPAEVQGQSVREELEAAARTARDCGAYPLLWLPLHPAEKVERRADDLGDVVFGGAAVLGAYLEVAGSLHRGLHLYEQGHLHAFLPRRTD